MIVIRYIDWGVFLLMSVAIYVLFPVGRWLDRAPLITLLFLGVFYVSYVVNRKYAIPLIIKGKRWVMVTAAMVFGYVLLMTALTCYHEGWPFFRLTAFYQEKGKVEMSQQRAWLFFLLVQAVSIVVSMVKELNRLCIQHREEMKVQEVRQEADASKVQEVRQEAEASQTISVKSGRRNVLIPLSDILYLEARNNYVYFMLTDGRQHKTLATLASLAAQLPDSEFVRIHKSFVVARSHVHSFNSHQVFVDHVSLPIGRTYAKGVKLK